MTFSSFEDMHVNGLVQKNLFLEKEDKLALWKIENTGGVRREFEVYFFTSQWKVIVKLLLSGLLPWTHVTRDLPHTKFIWEKQTLLSFSVPQFSPVNNKAHILMSSKPVTMQTVQNMGCFVLSLGSIWFISHWTRSKWTLLSYGTEKSGSETKCNYVHNWIQTFLSFLELHFVYCAEKHCDCVWWRWIIQNYESLVRTVKWSGQWGGGV